MFVGLLIPVLLAALPGNVTLQEVLQRHEDSLRKLYAIDASVVGRISRDGGDSWRIMSRFRIARQGREERFQEEVSFFDDSTGDGGKEFRDSLYTPEGRWALQGVDPEAPPREPLSFHDPESYAAFGRIKGSISPSAPFQVHGYPTPWVALLLLAPSNEQSLRDACASSSPRVQVESGKTRAGFASRILRIRPPKASFSLLIHVCPEFGYLIGERAVEVKGRTSSVFVSEFREIGPGAWFPVRLKGLNGDKPDSRTEFEVEDVRFNTPIPEERFKWRFLEGMVVSEEDKAGATRYHLWGRGAPARTFPDTAAFNAWLKQQSIAMRPRVRRGGWSTQSLALIALSTVALLVVIFARRKILAALPTPR